MHPDSIKVIGWPEDTAVTLAEARFQCGLMDDQTDFDGFLADKIATATRLVEKRLGMSIMPTQLRAVWLTAPAVLDLPAPPLLVDETHSLVVTVDGVEVDPGDYTVEEDVRPSTVTFDAQPTGKVACEYWAGHASATDIEPTVKSAILAYVLHSFENRGVLADGAAVELPQAFETLLAASSWNGGW